MVKINNNFIKFILIAISFMSCQTGMKDTFVKQENVYFDKCILCITSEKTGLLGQVERCYITFDNTKDTLFLPTSRLLFKHSMIL